jgi:hypothetical protein
MLNNLNQVKRFEQSSRVWSLNGVNKVNIEPFKKCQMLETNENC